MLPRSRQTIGIPSLCGSKTNVETIWNTFETTKVVLVRNYVSYRELRRTFGRKEVQELCRRYRSAIEDTFNVENAGNATIDDLSDVFVDDRQMTTTTTCSWYVSFIVQRDKDAMRRILETVPRPTVPSPSVATKAVHRDCVWVFYGQNRGSRPLDGRPEHLDSVSNIHGTWHVQVRGRKIWYLRQNKDAPAIRVECRPGDLLLIDTQRWWHHTEIPSTLRAKDRISLSYARDVRLEHESTDSEAMDAQPVTSSNIDCVYAANFVSAGSVVLTEDDLPDCELAISETPNCVVAETEDGLGVVVALRDIETGEIFTVAP